MGKPKWGQINAILLSVACPVGVKVYTTLEYRRHRRDDTVQANINGEAFTKAVKYLHLGHGYGKEQEKGGNLGNAGNKLVQDLVHEEYLQHLLSLRVTELGFVQPVTPMDGNIAEDGQGQGEKLPHVSNIN